MNQSSRIKRSLAEIIGTFALVFCGTGAIIIDKETAGAVTHVGIAFSLAGRLPVKTLASYIVSQVTGALLASGLLRLLFPANPLLGSTIPAGSAFQSFVLELVLTFILMLVIMGVSTGPKEQGLFAGIAVGAVVLLEAMFAGPICGGSMNPARSLGPALISGHIEHLWVYLTAPVAGAALAIPTSKYLNDKK